MNKNTISKKILLSAAVSALMLGSAAIPVMAANGDFYDKVNNVPYNAAIYRTDTGTFNTLISALDSRGQDFKFQNGSSWYKYSGMLTVISNQITAGKSLIDAFTYAKADIANADVAPAAITVTNARIVNGNVTVTLSSAPAVTPSINDFTVTANAIAITPTAISTNGLIVTLKVPVVVATTPEQMVVYGVSYKGEATVVANIQVTNLAPNSIKVGQIFNVVLAANPSTGYDWTYTTNNEAIKFIRFNTSTLSDPNLVGSPIEEIFTFQATQVGSFKMHFSMEQPWEGSTSSIQTIDYIINVT
jgi:predicted secreted protein